MEFLDLVKKGSVVKVNIDSSKDRLNPKTLKAIKESPKCIVNDLRITDGKGIGVVLELANGKKEWFFENEVEIIDEQGNILKRNKQEEINFLNLKFLDKFNYIKKNDPKELVNPINFFSWLIFSFKDIF
ncbi:MAG: hypothetical protein CMK49_03250 [Prochlorococcus sp. SP3034]|nr:hypothetical protein [Prochlorococcus sp. SP3034]|tara:strand:- start:1062 stop:1448 length:387 start_codon:yes stop_codon:yes gene_type:complete